MLSRHVLKGENKEMTENDIFHPVQSVQSKHNKAGLVMYDTLI